MQEDDVSWPVNNVNMQTDITINTQQSKAGTARLHERGLMF
jgi:hypothetical protein